jgi:hypothetical protein
MKIVPELEEFSWTIGRVTLSQETLRSIFLQYENSLI